MTTAFNQYSKADAAGTKPIKLYGHERGANPPKVSILLEELNLPYETILMDMKTVKEEPFVSVNPNGRVPAIEDDNLGVTLWESGAIMEYLVRNYDRTGRLHYGGNNPKHWLTQQWLFFQMSGQGPYFGQAMWFKRFHPEKIPSAIERYQNEVRRVTGVIDAHLAKTGQPALVGDKTTYADLSFVPWYWAVPVMDDDGALDAELHAKYPTWSKWIKALNERPSVKKILAQREAATKAAEAAKA